MTERILFDQATALAKVGQVIQADHGEGGYTLAIQWEFPERRAKLMVDWFTRNESERFLVEI